eukprot:2072899-Prymnesium_polylepis.1
MYAVYYREGVFVAESDDVFRGEGARGDALVVRVLSNDNFLQFRLALRSRKLASGGRGRGGAMCGRSCALWNPLLTDVLILGLMHRPARGCTWTGTGRTRRVEGRDPQRNRPCHGHRSPARRAADSPQGLVAQI